MSGACHGDVFITAQARATLRPRIDRAYWRGPDGPRRSFSYGDADARQDAGVACREGQGEGEAVGALRAVHQLQGAGAAPHRNSLNLRPPAPDKDHSHVPAHGRFFLACGPSGLSIPRTHPCAPHRARRMRFSLVSLRVIITAGLRQLLQLRRQAEIWRPWCAAEASHGPPMAPPGRAADSCRIAVMLANS